MGGPGSGKWVQDTSGPVAEEDIKWLFRGGLRKKLLDGVEDAQTEYLMRLDLLRMRERLSSQKHSDLVKSAAIRRSVALHINAEKRTRRAEAAIKRLEEARAPATNLRDVGPPPDDLNTDGAGEPESGD